MVVLQIVDGADELARRRVMGAMRHRRAGPNPGGRTPACFARPSIQPNSTARGGQLPICLPKCASKVSSASSSPSFGPFDQRQQAIGPWAGLPSSSRPVRQVQFRNTPRWSCFSNHMIRGISAPCGTADWKARNGTSPNGPAPITATRFVISYPRCVAARGPRLWRNASEELHGMSNILPAVKHVRAGRRRTAAPEAAVPSGAERDQRLPTGM